MINGIGNVGGTYGPGMVPRVERSQESRPVEGVRPVGDATTVRNGDAIKELVQLSQAATAMQASVRMADRSNAQIEVMLSKYRAEF